MTEAKLVKFLTQRGYI